MHALDLAPHDLHLRNRLLGILQGGAVKAVEVAPLHMVVVDDEQPPDAQARQEVDERAARAAAADHAHAEVAEVLVHFRAEGQRLAIMNLGRSASLKILDHQRGADDADPHAKRRLIAGSPDPRAIEVIADLDDAQEFGQRAAVAVARQHMEVPLVAVVLLGEPIQAAGMAVHDRWDKTFLLGPPAEPDERCGAPRHVLGAGRDAIPVGDRDHLVGDVSDPRSAGPGILGDLAPGKE